MDETKKKLFTLCRDFGKSALSLDETTSKKAFELWQNMHTTMRLLNLTDEYVKWNRATQNEKIA